MFDTLLLCILHEGKTTLLRHVLENSTEKIACIVNDVAAVNIDVSFVLCKILPVSRHDLEYGMI